MARGWLSRSEFGAGACLLSLAACGPEVTTSPEEPPSAGTTSGGRTSGASDAGAGGATDSGGQLQGGGEPLPVPGFTLLVAPPISESELQARAKPELDGVDEPTLVRAVGCRVSLTSADGSVLAGSVSYEWERPLAQRGFSWSTAFRWTAELGMSAGFLPGSDTNEALTLSADGGTVFGRGSDDTNQPRKVYRWSEEDGLEELSDPPYVFDYVDSVSADGRFALVRARNGDAPQTEALRWERGEGWASLGISEWPSLLQMSSDGATVRLTDTSVWSERDGVYDLASSCRLTELSQSGAAIGSCDADGGPFHLSLDRTLTAIDVADVFLSASRISADGSVVLLTASAPGDGFGLYPSYYRWTAATGPEHITELDDDSMTGALTLLSLSEDGRVLTANYEDEPSEAWFPVSWSAQDGRRDLEPAGGYEHSVAVAQSADGALVAGFSFNGSYYGEPGGEGVRPQKSSGHVVLWDQSGPRDLSEELAGVDADLSVLEESSPLFVANTADAIVIVGNGAQQAWVARLAPR